jgi:hypothetical protein
MGQGNVPATGNTPSGNVGAGTVETSSAPDAAGTPAGGAPATGPVTTTITDADFKKDGDLRADAVRRIEDNAPARGAERSFNEVTGKTTVTTVVDGRAVTFEQDGDTRGEKNG